jgi:hypothetical protein
MSVVLIAEQSRDHNVDGYSPVCRQPLLTAWYRKELSMCYILGGKGLRFN